MTPEQTRELVWDAATGRWRHLDRTSFAYIHFNGPSKHTLDATNVSLSRVRNSILRSQMQQSTRWVPSQQRQAALALLDAKENIPDEACRAVLRAHLNRMDWTEADWAAVHVACVEAVRPVISLAEFQQFVSFHDRALALVPASDVERVYRACNWLAR